MARPFTIELEVPEPPTEAAARAAIALAEPARAIGLRLTKARRGRVAVHAASPVSLLDHALAQPQRRKDDRQLHA